MSSSTLPGSRDLAGTPAARRGLRSRWAGRARVGQLLAVARRMAAEGLVVGTVGNVSIRDGDALRITPTRTAYATLRRRELVRVDLATGRPHDPSARPSRELPLHLAVYRARPDVGAVLHTHSLHAAAWSFLDEPLHPRLEDLDYYAIGEIRTAAPATPGSEQLAANVVAALGDARAVLLGDHGVLALGDTAEQALTIAQVVEHQARIAWMLRTGTTSAAASSYPRCGTASLKRP